MKLFSYWIQLITLLIGFRSTAFEINGKPTLFKYEKSFLPISEMSFCELATDANAENKTQFELELSKCNFHNRSNWNFGFTNKIIWTKFKLQNSSLVSLKKVILISHIYLNQIKVFERGTDQKVNVIQSIGLDIPLVDEQNTTSGFSITVDVPPNSEQEFLLRVQSKFPISLPLHIMDPIDYSSYITSIRYILIFLCRFCNSTYAL